MTTLRSKGFTLVELLVVISIIGILASIVLASLDSSRKKGRDARRLADIKQIQLALELYYDQNNAFPPNNGGVLNPTDLTGPGYISVVPTDPSTGASYAYVAYNAGSSPTATCISYHLGATLETNGHSALTQDADISANNAANGSVLPPVGYSICSAGTPPANDFDGLRNGAVSNSICKTAGSNIGTPVVIGGGGTETCYDVKP